MTSANLVTIKELEKKLSAVCTSGPLLALFQALEPDSSLHLVGGAIRDLASGVRQYDFDVATSLIPDEVVRRLQARSIRVIETAPERGTVLALVDSTPIEITTFRRANGRTQNEFSNSIEEDLSGRDFTINSLAFSFNECKILDPHDGLNDLRQKIVRAVGTPKDRFIEDPLRILRMYRFGPAQGRIIDAPTAQAAQKLKENLSQISPERIRGEIEKCILCTGSPQAFREMLKASLLSVILPEFVPMAGFEQNDFHIHDVFEHTLWVLARCPKDKILRLAALFHDTGKPYSLSIDEEERRHFYQHEDKSEEIVKKVMQRLRFSSSDTDRVSRLVRHHMRSIECGPAGARRILRDLEEDYDTWRLLKIADAPPTEAEDIFRERLKNFDELVARERERLKGSPYDSLVINGDDLIEIGFKEGPFLGKCLKELLELVLDDPSRNAREYLLSRAKDILEPIS